MRSRVAWRLTHTEIIVVCSVVVVAGLIQLLVDPGGADKKLRDTVQVAEVGTLPLRPTPRIAASRLAELPAIADPPRVDLTTTDGAAATDQLILMTLSQNSLFDRFEAIRALGATHAAVAELALSALLHDPDPAIRESAVESLASLGTHDAIGGLRYALSDADPLVRLSALEYLVEIGTPEALEALGVTLVDPDTRLRLAAVYELADSENEVTTALIQAFLSDADPTVRDAAAELLAE